MGKRLLAATALVAVCLILLPIAVCWMWLAIVVDSPRGKRLALAFDQLANVAAGGDEDESMSSRCWRYRYSRPYAWVRPTVDWVALHAFGDQYHCRMSWIGECHKRGLPGFDPRT